METRSMNCAWLFFLGLWLGDCDARASLGNGLGVVRGVLGWVLRAVRMDAGQRTQYPYREQPTRPGDNLFPAMSRFKWYRKRVGGRWSQELIDNTQTPPKTRWTLVTCCPGRHNFDQYGYDVPDFICYSDVELGLLKNRECHCEVWK